jgi:hypothetical protein
MTRFIKRRPRRRVSNMGSFDPISIAPTLIGSGGAVWSTGAVTPGLPAAHQANDILLLAVLTANTAVGTPTDWAIVTNSPQGTGTANNILSARLSVFWKRSIGASETDPITVADSGDMQFAKIWGFRGCPTSGDPWDITAGNTGSNTASVSCPTVTTTVPSCLIFAIAAHGIDADGTQLSVAFANSNLTNLTATYDNSTVTGNGGGLVAARGIKVSPGATGATTATLGTATEQGRMTIALKPA